MEVLYVLVPLSLMLVSIGILIFIWAVKSGQFDDLEGPAHNILYDDDASMIPKDARTQEQQAIADSDDADAPSADSHTSPAAGKTDPRP
ncbi:cbb3-type cytochrome oxidase assembly protein CcoS [Mangrovitalea sediminis]|uniref:cbb3-type cytochrome oxidase assembly protein CcoS n=1 Tax=Mangrovitalea sediminis TaxID=1982043 RepID=UPI000BE4E279|nr:cbb3-type cytochrome oxidase assembly protein CcoS [Mangrovitalea sediminis]